MDREEGRAVSVWTIGSFKGGETKSQTGVECWKLHPRQLLLAATLKNLTDLN